MKICESCAQESYSFDHQKAPCGNTVMNVINKFESTGEVKVLKKILPHKFIISANNEAFPEALFNEFDR